jgi:hypothetical protein
MDDSRRRQRLLSPKAVVQIDSNWANRRSANGQKRSFASKEKPRRSKKSGSFETGKECNGLTGADTYKDVYSHTQDNRTDG